MKREKLIQKTIESLAKLPDHQLREVSDFAEYLLHKMEDRVTNEGIQKLVSDAKAFKFLEEEEDLYTVHDLKEKYQ
jgi:hypothetical protein